MFISTSLNLNSKLHRNIRQINLHTLQLLRLQLLRLNLLMNLQLSQVSAPVTQLRLRNPTKAQGPGT